MSWKEFYCYMSKYKMIVLDMDDTLMNGENQVSPETNPI